RYYAMPGRRLAVMLSRSPRLAGDDPRLSIDALTSSLKPFKGRRWQRFARDAGIRDGTTSFAYCI
ncbi:hypothetical protein ACJX0J_016554, partial [Zea mays]